MRATKRRDVASWRMPPNPIRAVEGLRRVSNDVNRTKDKVAQVRETPRMRGCGSIPQNQARRHYTPYIYKICVDAHSGGHLMNLAGRCGGSTRVVATSFSKPLLRGARVDASAIPLPPKAFISSLCKIFVICRGLEMPERLASCLVTRGHT